MAISLEELVAVALEGTVGPVTLAVGASALAVALAAGSTRPLRRIAATSVFAANRTRQRSVRDWVVAARHRWSSLVDEARAEYEASGHPAQHPAASSIMVATAAGVVPETGSVVVPGLQDGFEAVELQEAHRTRDQRGRFVRRATNGSRP